jgi:hypothetical protein
MVECLSPFLRAGLRVLPPPPPLLVRHLNLPGSPLKGHLNSFNSIRNDEQSSARWLDCGHCHRRHHNIATTDSKFAQVSYYKEHLPEEGGQAQDPNFAFANLN